MSDDAPLPAQGLRSTVRSIGAIVGPSSAVVALLFYFGWVRASYEARQLGLDDSLFGFSTWDYILQSISSLEGAFLVGAAVILASIGAHRLVVSWSVSGAARQITLLAWAIGVVGVVLGLLGLLGARVSRPTRFVSLWAPLSLVAGIALVSYGVHLLHQYGPRRSTASPAAAAGGATGEVAGLNALAAGLMSALLLVAVMRAVSHYAAVRGIELAAQAQKFLEFQPDVTIFSAKRLGLQPSIVETTIAGDDGAYRYRYTGLKLLFRANDRFFLRPSDPNDQRNIILADNDDVRLELAPAH